MSFADSIRKSLQYSRRNQLNIPYSNPIEHQWLIGYGNCT